MQNLSMSRSYNDDNNNSMILPIKCKLKSMISYESWIDKKTK